MSDALSDIEKEKKSNLEWKKHIKFFVDRIYKQTRHIKGREDWEMAVDDHIECITKQIYEEMEIKWGKS